MSKEITLENLAASAKPVQKIEQPKPVEAPVVKNDPKVSEEGATHPTEADVKKANIGPKMGTANIKRGTPKLNGNQVADALIKAGKMEAKKDDSEDAPVVKEAFEGMQRTLQQRKEGMDQLLETMKANAEEDALDAELAGGAPLDESVSAPVQQQSYTEVPRPATISSDDDEMLDAALAEDEDEDDLDPEPIKPPRNVKENQQSVNKKVETDMSQYNIDSDNTSEQLELEIQAQEGLMETKPESEKVARPKANDNIVKMPAQPATAQDKENEDLDKLLRDLDEDDSIVDTEEETQDEIIAKFKKSFEEVKVNQDQVDFSKFTIKQKPISSAFVLNNLASSTFLKKADWVLYHSGRTMTFSECFGPELESLRRTMENANDINRVIASLRFVYEHVVDPNKPSFEAWTKLIRTEDIDSAYYGIYRACYSDSNLVARTCTADACKKTSLIDTNIDDMVVYGRPDDDHDAVKKRFNEIFQNDTTTETSTFKSSLMQISNDLAVAYSPATLYSTFVVYATLKPDITQRYSETLSTMSYIDNFFYIDRNDNSLSPIQIKEYPGNLNKTVLNKLKVYRQILKSLSNDQFNVFMGKLNNLIEQPKITYKLPACKCPECDAEIPETPVDSMINLLFMRAQLARIRSL